MSRESTLRAGRRWAQDTMTDTVRVERQTGVTALDPESLQEVPVREFKFRTNAKIQVGALGSLVPTARERFDASREITTTRTVLKVPVDEKVFEANDIVTVETVGDLSDVGLLGQEFMIVAPVAGSYQTSRRFAIEAVVA